MYEQCYHGQVAGDGEDVDRGGRLLADVDLLVGDMVADGQGLCVEKSAIRLAFEAQIRIRVQAYRCYADPAREHEARVFEAAGEGEDGEGEVGVDGVDCEQPDNGRLRGVVDEPA